MRLIDADIFMQNIGNYDLKVEACKRDSELEKIRKVAQAVQDHAVQCIKNQSTIDPEDLPLVQELREELKLEKNEDLASWYEVAYNRQVKEIADIGERLAKITEERDLAVKYLRQANNDSGACYGCKWFDSFADRCTSKENKIVCDTGDNNKWEWKGV